MSTSPKRLIVRREVVAGSLGLTEYKKAEQAAIDRCGPTKSGHALRVALRQVIQENPHWYNVVYPAHLQDQLERATYEKDHFTIINKSL